jgi:hypothetical protein
MKVPGGKHWLANHCFRERAFAHISLDYRSEYSKGYSKALEYEYRVKTAALGTLKRYSIISLIVYLE